MSIKGVQVVTIVAYETGQFIDMLLRAQAAAVIR